MRTRNRNATRRQTSQAERETTNRVSGAHLVIVQSQPQRVDLLIITTELGDRPGERRAITIHGVDPDEAQTEIAAAYRGQRPIVVNTPTGPERIPLHLVDDLRFIHCDCGRGYRFT